MTAPLNQNSSQLNKCTSLIGRDIAAGIEAGLDDALRRDPWACILGMEQWEIKGHRYWNDGI